LIETNPTCTVSTKTGNSPVMPPTYIVASPCRRWNGTNVGAGDAFLLSGAFVVSHPVTVIQATRIHRARITIIFIGLLFPGTEIFNQDY
jgi:hypothetical protein